MGSRPQAFQQRKTIAMRRRSRVQRSHATTGIERLDRSRSKALSQVEPRFHPGEEPKIDFVAFSAASGVGGGAAAQFVDRHLEPEHAIDEADPPFFEGPAIKPAFDLEEP